MLRDSYSAQFTDADLRNKLELALMAMDEFRMNPSLFAWNKAQQNIKDCIKEFEDRDEKEMEAL